MMKIKLLALVIFVMMLMPSCSSNKTVQAPDGSRITQNEMGTIPPSPISGVPSSESATSDNQEIEQSSGVAQADDSQAPAPPIIGEIYLYGETHGVEAILDKELELWNEYYYHNNGFRHLFIEFGYCSAEYLNIWIQSDNDEILELIYNDWYGTAAYKPSVREFYRAIKEKCPETVFHGIDIEHQHNSVGTRYLNYLKENSLDNSEQLQFALDAIEQGRKYAAQQDEAYRENMLSENFIREFDKMNGESVVGFFGSAHTALEAMDRITNSAPCMGNQLLAHYGGIVHSEDLSWMALKVEPESVDEIEVNGNEYPASYFGRVDITWSTQYTYMEFWRLENAYEDLQDAPKTGNGLPYKQFPMVVGDGQVFIIDVHSKNGSTERQCYLSEGYIVDNDLWTQEVLIG